MLQPNSSKTECILFCWEWGLCLITLWRRPWPCLKKVLAQCEGSHPEHITNNCFCKLPTFPLHLYHASQEKESLSYSRRDWMEADNAPFQVQLAVQKSTRCLLLWVIMRHQSVLSVFYIQLHSHYRVKARLMPLCEEGFFRLSFSISCFLSWSLLLRYAHHNLPSFEIWSKWDR